METICSIRISDHIKLIAPKAPVFCYPPFFFEPWLENWGDPLRNFEYGKVFVIDQSKKNNFFIAKLGLLKTAHKFLFYDFCSFKEYWNICCGQHNTIHYQWWNSEISTPLTEVYSVRIPALKVWKQIS